MNSIFQSENDENFFLSILVKKHTTCNYLYSYHPSQKEVSE